MNKFKQKYSKINILFGLIFILSSVAHAQNFPSVNDYKYIRIGDLQDRVSAYGGERGWNNVYYEGKKWPAQYPLADNFVIQRNWFAIEDFTDEKGVHWDHWANYLYAGYADVSIYPMHLEQVAKFEVPQVYVDGINISAPYNEDVDRIDPNIPSDRMVINTINTTAGITVTRRILAFSQQYHDDYFIRMVTYKNTGNTDYDDDIELTSAIKGLRIGWGNRYGSREGAATADNQHSWGKHSWVTRRGEAYASHAVDVANFTESTTLDQLEWIRAGFSWFGQSELLDYDNIGAPERSGTGRLTGHQFQGSAVIHVDKSATDKSDDPNQPVFLGWHAGDTYPGIGNLREEDADEMSEVYTMISGTPYGGDGNGGTNRMFEDNVSSLIDRVDPYKIHGDGGGTNVMMTYGPFDLAHGDSITIVEVDAVNGLSRPMCEEIGAKWLQGTGTYDLPPSGQFADLGVNYGGTTTDPDLYKNAWVYTGADSIMMSFRRAIANYNLNFEIPQPPAPPSFFEVNSGGDKITLTWGTSASEGESNFGGYRVYRAVGKRDTVFTRVAEVGPGVLTYEDKAASRGFSYYYYVTSITDGSLNTAGIANPTGILESGKFYTMTNKAAFLKRQAGEKLSDIRIVPNPYNIRATQYQYTGEPDKIMFLDIPAYCKIKIFTERGDLVTTINHNDGSGDETWNSMTNSRQEIVSGVYIAYFEVTKDYTDSGTGELLYKKGQHATKKFVVIR
ncbi:MAG: fibronectin [Calditrichaeota bacterium]|nr:fibronectin [Calditrichota bacterium]